MEIGDEVTWTHCSTRGKSVTMSLRDGVIEELRGGVAIVHKRGGRREEVAVSRLRLPGQRSQLSEFVEAIFEGARSE